MKTWEERQVDDIISLSLGFDLPTLEKKVAEDPLIGGLLKILKTTIKRNHELEIMLEKTR